MTGGTAGGRGGGGDLEGDALAAFALAAAAGGSCDTLALAALAVGSAVCGRGVRDRSSPLRAGCFLTGTLALAGGG